MRIGIKFYPNDDGTLPIRKTTPDAKCSLVSLRNFYKTYNIDFSLVKGTYSPTKENIAGLGELFVVDISHSV